MIADPGYQAATHHRTAGLERTELVVTAPWFVAGGDR